jgi:hypothetical protein
MSGSRAVSPEDFANAEQHVLDGSPSEHIYLASEPEAGQETESEPQSVLERFQLKDGRRRLTAQLTLYEGGVLKLYRRRGKKRLSSHTIKLRYLDAIPTVSRHVAWRWLWAALGAAALAIAAAALAQLAPLRPFALPAAAAAGLAAAIAACVFYWRSHETTAFYTLNGRARAITLTASVGRFRQGRGIRPKLARAIAAAEETIGEDTALYLRAEMREHYRLRHDGVLSSEDCTESTGRILAQFDNRP